MSRAPTHRAAFLACFAAMAIPCFSADPPPKNNDAFEMRVRPLLVKACYSCHTDAGMGGLQLDSREHMLKGGKSGASVVPGNPDGSPLIQAVRYTAKRKMPPTGKLSDEEIATLESWVTAGAVWPENLKPAAAPKSAPYVITAERRNFWAFRPVADHPVPAVKDQKWARTEIDRFILAKLEANSLQPAAAANKRTLIRRATFDLTGLPPSPEEVDAFEKDRSPNAFAKVVDRLLASPQYGERWGRYWLDIARYSDDKLNSTMEEPYPNAFRYRDWVIQAFNSDMPYDTFVKAQIAGDLMPDPDKYRAGLGFYALSPEFQDDRVDATTRGFLALTVACAQCHDHKFDPIPTRDYYSLLGILSNTKLSETPLAPKDVVEVYQAAKKKVDAQDKKLKDYLAAQAGQLSEIMAAQTAHYMLAAAGAGPKDNLDPETLTKWVNYLKTPEKEHPYLKPWFAAGKDPANLAKAADDFQAFLLKVNAEKKVVDDKNHITLGLDPSRKDLSSANLVSLERDKFVLWEDFFSEQRGILYYKDGKIDRFLSGEWKNHLAALRTDLAAFKKDLPPQYPFLQTIEDLPKWREQRVWLRGSRDNPGDPAPPHFLQILSAGDPAEYKNKPRLELAEGIASPTNPLTARVIVNRIWQHHLGQGMVRTPSNFGLQGDTPSHPELLDYLASRFMKEGWSMKKLHREIMLSSVYALSAESSEKNFERDPENRMLWRFNRRRLDAEGLRDSLLLVSGKLDPKPGGAPVKFSPDNYRRTAYGFVSRKKLDAILSLFDFPNPNSLSEQRIETNVPLQRLFFLNSDFIAAQSKALAARLGDDPNSARIDKAYELLFQRKPTAEEKKLGLQYLEETKDAWPQYAQVLLSSNEFSFVN
jgi:mono/diheme cytochrome c family protein